MRKKSPKLFSSFAPGQPEVEVVEHDRATMSAIANDRACLQRAALFPSANRQVNVLPVMERKLGEDDVSVAPLLVAVLVAEFDVRETQSTRELVHLLVKARLRPPDRDFLQERQARVLFLQVVDDSIKSVLSVDAANALVNVPGQDSQLHFRTCLRFAIPRGHSPTGVNMIDEVLEELKSGTEKAHEALKRELSKLRTGRAHPGMLDSVRVDYYGTPTPISQMAAVGVPEPRMLTVKPWEKNLVAAIDKALRESNLGINPQVDGDLIRVPVPPLSEERRRDLTKIAKKNGEDCRIAIRKARHEAIDMLAEIKKNGDAGEDAVERAKKKAEEVITEATKAVESLVLSKEEEILKI